MKHQNVRQGGNQQLLAASLLVALLAPPVRDIDRRDGTEDGLRHRHLRPTLAGDGELNQAVLSHVRVGAVLASNVMTNLESHKLVKKGNLITEKLEEFVRVANALAGGHRDCLHALIQCVEALIPLAGPYLGHAHLDGVLGVLLTLTEACL